MKIALELINIFHKKIIVQPLSTLPKGLDVSINGYWNVNYGYQNITNEFMTLIHLLFKKLKVSFSGKC